MSRAAIGPRLGIGGLVLGALAAQTIAPSGAQTPTGEQEPIQAIGRDARAGALEDERPALGEDEVRALMGERFGVEVLKIEAMERGPAYAVTVMNPPGNDNGAFLVEILVVDGATGEVLGRVPQRPRVAPGLAAHSGQADLDGGGLEIRRRSHR